jgi:hypothetical protein
MYKLDQGLGFSVSYSFSPQQIIRQWFPPKESKPADEAP